MITASVITARPLSGCVGRLLWRNSSVKARICSADRLIGVLMTIQLTPSEHGGVVSEPS